MKNKGVRKLAEVEYRSRTVVIDVCLYAIGMSTGEARRTELVKIRET
jgi:hypothetical protein